MGIHRRIADASRAASAGVALLAAAHLLVAPALAQEGAGPPGMAIIRDAEIEQLMRDYTAPIFRDAGINAKATKPVWAKMTPNVTDITAPARTSLLAGCEGVAAINTITSGEAGAW